ncbi:MAG: SGNH/GDSL hydrolase family protein [Armatimonadetes bacterium]|nr:SGNH/GDSL hydrolase family protein [Armatimonadota bacterium]
MRTALAVVTMALMACAVQAQDAAKNFFLHDGDTVVFYGDSITEQQMYAADIENYVTTRFPKMRVRFINSGWGGDRVSGGGGGPIETRLRRDVLPYKPTVVTIFLGMNDGGYHPFDEPTFQTYARGLTHIVDELQKSLPHVRLTLFTPSLFDNKDGQPAGSAPYNQALIKYGDFVKQLGARRGIPVVDLNAPMVAATVKGRETDPKFTLANDNVHPGPVGHLIMASAILQVWDAPPALGLVLTPGQPTTLTLPAPWPVPGDAHQALDVSPLPGPLARVTVTSSAMTPPDARYALLADGQVVGTFTGAQLAPGAGVDLTQYPDLPLNKQAQAVAAINNERINRWHEYFKGGNGIARADDKPTRDEIGALTALDKWLDAWRVRAHDSAQPKPHTFELRSAAATTTP